MATNENLIPIPGRLHSVATEGHVSGADEIYDDTLQKDQQTINAEVNAALGEGGTVDEKIAEAIDDVAFIDDSETSPAVVPSFDPESQTVHITAQTLSEQQKQQVRENIGLSDVDAKINEAVASEASQRAAAVSGVQNSVNAEATRAQAAEADRYTKNETYTKEEVHNLITTPNQEYVSVTATDQTTSVTDVLPATGAADTTYRIGNWDGTQYNDSVFSEYAWNGSAYIKLSTKSQIGEVYDISANHADTKYADLAAALGNNGANIPQSLQRGGMSVKYVQTSDNKYVQWRYMSSSTTVVDFTNVNNWQGIDNIPTNGSNNLVESGGVADIIENNVIGTINKNLTWVPGWIMITGLVVASTTNKYTQPFLLKAGESIRVGTHDTNVSIICTTNLDEISLGNTVTPIKTTSSKDRYETYTYTAEQDIKLVICVLSSNYTLNIFNSNSLGIKLDNTELEINGGEITKDLFWEDGWIRVSDSQIVPHEGIKFTQPFLLKAGERVSVGTRWSNIGIICTTTSQSLSFGDIVIILQKTKSDDFETHTFVAEKDTYIVLCVNWSDYSLHFYYEGIKEKLSDIDKNFVRTFALDHFSITVPSNQTFSYIHNIQMFAGELMKVTCSFTSGMYSPSDFYFYLDFEDGTSSPAILIPANIAKYIQLPKNIVSVTLLSNISSLIEGIVTCDISLSYNSIYGNWSFIVPDYYNINNYLSNKEKYIESLLIKVAGNSDLFAFITDEHWERNAKNSPALLRYFYDHININKCINGGDSWDLNFGDLTSGIEFSKILKNAFRGNIFHVIGNHEYLAYYYHSGDFSASILENKTAYAYFMGTDEFIGNILRGYYYYDDPERKLRYIVLSAYRPGEEQHNPDESYVIRATSGYEQEQLQWLENIALNVENNWNIIISTHSINDYINENNKFIPVVGSFGNICEILLRYNGNGKIICVLAGHAHKDGIVLINDDFVGITENKTGNTIPVIVTTCDAYYFDDEPGEKLENRQVGTITENAFDIDIVDYFSKDIHCIRIGAPANFDFSKSGSLEERIINYLPIELNIQSSTTLNSGLSGNIEWSSADNNIVTVTSSGIATGVSSGSAFVFATDTSNHISKTFIIKVI